MVYLRHALVHIPLSKPPAIDVMTCRQQSIPHAIIDPICHKCVLVMEALGEGAGLYLGQVSRDRFGLGQFMLSVCFEKEQRNRSDVVDKRVREQRVGFGCGVLRALQINHQAPHVFHGNCSWFL